MYKKIHMYIVHMCIQEQVHTPMAKFDSSLLAIAAVMHLT